VIYLEWKPCTKKAIQVSYRDVEGEKEEIKTREGTLFAYANKDFIIKGVSGEIYPIKKKIFAKTYDIDKSLKAKIGALLIESKDKKTFEQDLTQILREIESDAKIIDVKYQCDYSPKGQRVYSALLIARR
jgi:hypothetical protein